MAENKNYSKYYTPLEIGNNDLDWSLLNKHRSGLGFNWQIIAGNIDAGYLSKASSGPRSVNGENRDVRDWSTAFTYEETRDPQFLAKFIKSSGILSEENLAELGEDWDGFFDGTLSLKKYHAIIGAYAIGTTNSKTSYATDKINKNLGKVTPAKEYVTQLDTLTTNLESYGANPAEIQTYLENKTWADAADVSSTITNLADTWEQSGQDTQQFQVLLTQAQNDSQDSDSKELGNILLTQQPSNDDNTTGTTEGNATEGNATEGGITPTDQTTVSVATADDRQTTLNTAVDNTFLGQSSLEALRNYADETDNISYRFDEETGRHFLDTTDEDGNVTDEQEFAVDNNNNQVIYVGGEKDGQRFSQGGVIEDIESSKAVEDQAFQDQQALVDELGGLRNEYGDFLTSYTGGEVTPAVAQQLGWTNNGDGTYTDPSDPSKTYTLNEETGTLESDGVAATTEGLNTQNDFASQINEQLNIFLNGPKDADGNPVTDDEGNPIKGFLDIQADLSSAAENLRNENQAVTGYTDENGKWVSGEYDKQLDTLKNYITDYQKGTQSLTGSYNPDKIIYDEDGNQIGTGGWEGGLYDQAYQDLAGKTEAYKTKFGTLADDYDKAYQGYADDLDPLTTEARRVRNQLGDIGDMSLRVANDANNPNYYSRLQDLYYQDAKDTIDRTTRGARDSLNQQYAQAGLDPSSPAYTAAMMDLQNSRSDALRSSRRQAILDSYGLGSQMLGNRQTSLTSAANTRMGEMTGLNNEMNALDSLYGVKLAGLNSRQDMIGKMYNIDRNLSDQKFNMLGARQDALNQNLNTNLDLYGVELDRLQNRTDTAKSNFDTAATLADIYNTGLQTQLTTNLEGLKANQSQFQNDRQFGLDALDQRLKLLGLEFDAQGNIRQTADTQGTDASDNLVDLYTGGKSDALTYATLEDLAKQRGEELDPWIKDVFGR